MPCAFVCLCMLLIFFNQIQFSREFATNRHSNVHCNPWYFKLFIWIWLTQRKLSTKTTIHWINFSRYYQLIFSNSGLYWQQPNIWFLGETIVLNSIVLLALLLLLTWVNPRFGNWYLIILLKSKIDSFYELNSMITTFDVY